MWVIRKQSPRVLVLPVNPNPRRCQLSLGVQERGKGQDILVHTDVWG